MRCGDIKSQRAEVVSAPCSTTTTVPTFARHIMTSRRYVAVAQRKQAQLNAAIPEKWKLPTGIIPPGMLSIPDSITDPRKYQRVGVMDIPRTCGLLTPKELEITEKYNVRTLVAAMIGGQLKAEDVMRAFCKV